MEKNHAYTENNFFQHFQRIIRVWQLLNKHHLLEGEEYSTIVIQKVLGLGVGLGL